MRRDRPSFPPGVARSLQEPSGSASVRYTLPAPLGGPPEMDMLLMATPYEAVLAALTLDTKLNLRFVRTGNRAEGARVAYVNVAALIGAGRHWDISLAWDPEEMTIEVRDQHAADGPRLQGTSRATSTP
jgi:hypothetical protein